MERLLLRSASVERLLRGACLKGQLLRTRLLAGEAGELGLKLTRSLRLRLLNTRETGVLILQRRRSLTKTRRLWAEGTRLLLLLLLLLAWLLTERGPELLRASGTHAIAAAHERVRLGIHGVVAVVIDAPRASFRSRLRRFVMLLKGASARGCV